MKLKIAFIQCDLAWEDRHANIKYFENAINEIGQSADLILLPEMFDSGFTMRASKVAQPSDGPVLNWMKYMAEKSKALLLGSTVVEEKGNYYNRLFWVEPTGQSDFYDKRHLFRMGDEHKTFTPGGQKLVRSWKGWQICPLTCYDLRFPVWSRNRLVKDKEELEYDLLVFLANWPASRIVVWDTLLKARALENQAYVAGINRIGEDGEGISYNGHSKLFDFKGSVILDSGQGMNIRIVEIDKQALTTFRRKFPAFLDADSFRIDGK